VAKGVPLSAGATGRDEIGRLGQLDLETSVAQRTVELNAANEELRKANEIRRVVI
jgi:hypothetical protein